MARARKKDSSGILALIVVVIIAGVMGFVIYNQNQKEDDSTVRSDRAKADAEWEKKLKEETVTTPKVEKTPVAAPPALTENKPAIAKVETPAPAPAQPEPPVRKPIALFEEKADPEYEPLTFNNADESGLFPWEKQYAKVYPNGDMEWTPKEFSFVKGSSVRYIDYENGKDSNNGTSKTTPWKHHPWDKNAQANAKSCSGIHTYVFKGGVMYRGLLEGKESGTKGNPIRLTRDPSWGKGAAVIAGSEPVTGWAKGKAHSNIPDAGKVWSADIDFSPRTLWMVEKSEKVTRIPLAREPNWQPHPEDHMEEWYKWTNAPFKQKTGPVAYDDKHLKGKPKDFVNGAIIYSEFGWVMGTPYPSRVTAFNPSNGGVNFGRWTGGGRASVIFFHMRYYLEDKPQYLDDPSGEFWFEKKGGGGTLHVRLPGGKSPNSVTLEAGKRPDLIVLRGSKHVDISGLDFRYTTQHWDLTMASWDFSTKPWGFRQDAHPACVRIWGTGENIRVANCTFTDVVMPVVAKATGSKTAFIDKILIEDNKVENTDTGVFSVSSGSGWGFAHQQGLLGDVKCYRNYAKNVGMRPGSYFRGTSMNFGQAKTLHVAGNIIELSGGQGINVVGGKSGTWGDVPFTRSLIHQNKAWRTMRISNDFGGIEAWQHGPIYIFNNLSYDARGMWEGRRSYHGSSPGFGHAYYLDGGFKCYLFNNIAWGKGNDPKTKLVNCSAFQEIHSYQNMFFNNTAYNYYVGSRRQAPHAGRNKFLGNVWQGISKRVFRHCEPAKTEADGNAHHAGKQKSHFAYETNAYSKNVFYDVAEIGCFETSGRWLSKVADFAKALAEQKSLTADVGIMDSKAPLRNPAKGDFRPSSGSKSIDAGAKVFTPWALSGVVGEWGFYHAGNDPSRIIDEHWYAADYMVGRGSYHNMPMYPLMAVNVTAEDYEDGVLDNWVKGALTFKADKKQYAAVSNSYMMEPIKGKALKKSKHEGGKEQPFTITGKDIKNPQIYDGNFLIEVYFKTAQKDDALLAGKMAESGFALKLLKSGHVELLTVGTGGSKSSLKSKSRVNDGKWHHVIAEADRRGMVFNIYVDGKKDASGKGAGKDPLENGADFCVGGTPNGEYFDGTMEFLRLAHGTLAEAQTSIEELYKWQFDGPADRDFTGRRPKGLRDAGAIELTD